MNKLKECVQTSNEVHAERILNVLKHMIKKSPELKIENKMISLCDILDKTTNLTVAQARVLQALAPTIAPKVFSKQFFF